MRANSFVGRADGIGAGENTMKKIKVVLTCAIVCLVIASPVWAQETANVAGKWVMTSESPRGTQTSTFSFEQEGNVLTGSMSTPRGDREFTMKRVEG
jgi:hypothetical protein